MSASAAAPAAGAASVRTRAGWSAAAATVVAVFVALSLLTEAFAPAPSGPAGSAFSTTPAGVAAWASLLARNGHPVGTVRDSLASAPLAPAATLVVLDAGALTRGQTRHLRAFVDAGGTLVIGGANPARTLPGLLAPVPAWASAGPTVAHAVGAGPEVSGVSSVRTAGRGAWTDAGGAQILLAGAGGALLQRLRLGSGRVELLADTSPLENGLLASADNAQLSLNLAGAPGRPVLFAESVHGFTTATGLAAIPPRWWVLAVGLALSGGLFALSRARRLGPPEAPAPPPAPARSAYVDALAAALVRARDPETLAAMASNVAPSVSEAMRQ